MIFVHPNSGALAISVAIEGAEETLSLISSESDESGTYNLNFLLFEYLTLQPHFTTPGYRRAWYGID